ncbi:MAG: dTMP kinase [Steroidobacterales bacterium]
MRTGAVGRFITLEGIEGAGKSTIARELATELTRRGLSLQLTREPGGTPLAEQLRALLLAHAAEAVTPAAELLLMFAARSLHVENLIRPALARGVWVICDRFTDATRAYQGAGRGMDAALIESLAIAVHGNLQPERTLLLDVSVDVGLARARARSTHADRFEEETRAFFERVRRRYLALAALEPRRFRVIDASVAPSQVLDQSLMALDDLLDNII